MSFLNWLKKPYYFISSPKFNLLLSFGVGFFIFLFLYSFRPFGISNSLNNKLLYTGGFGLVTFIIQSLLFLIPPLLFKSYFSTKNWTVGKNILFLIVLVISISFGNYFYNSLIHVSKSKDSISVLTFFKYTFSISIFPIIIFTYISEKLYTFFRKKNIEKHTSYKSKSKNEITLLSDNKKDTIKINLDNLIYLTSKRNYVALILLKNNTVEEKIIRKTLTNIAIDLKNYRYFIKCHKSYIINTNYMKSISGNARGYYLNSDYLNYKIPVSRSIKKEDLKNLIT